MENSDSWVQFSVNFTEDIINGHRITWTEDVMHCMQKRMYDEVKRLAEDRNN